MNRRCVLISGITGFLGSQLAHRLAAEKIYTFVGIHRQKSDLWRIRDIGNQIVLYSIEEQSIETILRSQPIDTVINCVADYGRNKSVLDVLRANVVFPLQLLDAAVNQGVKAFINAGTSLPAKLNSYALTKHQFSQWMTSFSTKLVAIDLQLEHFYGPGESPERFITYVIDQLLKPSPQLDLTHGEQNRDFLHVDDVTNAIMLLLDRGSQWKPGYYNFSVGSGQAYVLREVVEQIRRLTGNQFTKINYGAIPYRDGEVMESVADIGKLRALGWEPLVSLNQGLQETVDAFREPITRRIAG